MNVVVAIPTIIERDDAWKKVAYEFTIHTCQPVEAIPAWRKPSWAAGLNEVWEQRPDADVFVCASDDMSPADDYWLPPLLDCLERDLYPAPTVVDPRFTYPPEGTEADEPMRMSTFPVLKREWLEAVFPLDPQMHYFSDDLIADRLRAIGVKCVACPQSRIIHGFDTRGRGAGMGDESTRMAHDKVIYKATIDT